MVQITPLLHALSAAAQIAPRDAPPTALVARQTFDPSSLPPACQSPCGVINTMTNCGSSISCLCASSVGSELQQCMSCLVSSEPTVQSDAQSAIDSWNQACGGSLTLTSGSSTGGTTGGTSGGTSGGTTSETSGGTTTTSAKTGSTTGGSTSSNPLGGGSGGAMGLKAAGVAVGIVAAFVGGFMLL